MTDSIVYTRIGPGLWRIEAWGGVDGYVIENNVPTSELHRWLDEFAQYDGAEIETEDAT
jgi:hypothetical protein